MSSASITFKEAKNRATSLLSRLAEYAKQLQEFKGGLGFMEWEQTLRVIEKKVNISEGPFHCKREAEEIYNFGYNLAKMYQPLEKQLLDFWNLWHDAFKLWKQSPQSYRGFRWWMIDKDLRNRMEEADMMAADIVASAREKSHDLLAAHALLNTHVARTESIEYVMMRILENCIYTFGLSSQYDAASMCSVMVKVPKGKTWVTDGRAVRDAVSHRHYLVKPGEDGWTVSFSNTEKGYNFRRIFSHIEFSHFFDQITLLYKIQLALLNALELLTIFANYLCKDADLY